MSKLYSTQNDLLMKNLMEFYNKNNNLDKILYKDHADTCYKFTAQNVKCPTDKNKIRSYNVQ